MRVLSPWFQGAPPKPGLWLVRSIMARDWDGGSMCVWDGAMFTDIDGTPIRTALTNVEYRGLAFNPEAADRYYELVNGAISWVVTEPKP